MKDVVKRLRHLNTSNDASQEDEKCVLKYLKFSNPKSMSSWLIVNDIMTPRPLEYTRIAQCHV